MKKVLGQTVRDLKREVNKKVLKVPGIEQKVLDATSNESWGPHGSHLAEIAHATRNYNEYQMIMAVLWKRINDTGKNWRHVYKALTVLEYLVAHGSERVIDEIREHAYHISTLSDFQYIDSGGRDQGSNVRKKSQSLVVLVNDKDRIQEVRQKASANRDKYRGPSSTGGIYKPSPYSSTGGGYGDRYDDDRYEGCYGNRDEDQNGYGREREWSSRNEDQYGSGGDSYGQGGDRYSRDADERNGKDSYGDDDYRGSQSNDDYQSGSRHRSSDREKERPYEDDDRSGGGRADGYPQDDRRLEQKLSGQQIGAPPSYEEAVTATRSPSQNESGRDGGTQAATAPKAASPQNGSPDQAPAAAAVASPVRKEVDSFDEFDPRGSVSATPFAATSAEMDFFGSILDLASPNPLAIMPVTSATTASEPDTLANSSFGTTFVALSSASTMLNQPSENPFGEAPFKATPSQDSFPTQPQNFAPTSSFPPPSTSEWSQPLQPVAQKADPLSDFDFGESFQGITYPPSVQLSHTNQEFSPQEFSSVQPSDDILAGILPQSTPAAPLAPEVSNFLPQSVGPAAFATQPASLTTLTPQPVGPSPFASQPGIPAPFASQQGSPAPFAPQLGIPAPFTPQPGIPAPFAPQPGIPAPFAQQLGMPAPFAPQLVGPASFASQSIGPASFAPQPVGSASFTSQLSGPIPSAPQPVGPAPFAQQSVGVGPGPAPLSSQPATAAPMGLPAQSQPHKDKFEPKSTVWADTLSRGLVNLNISGAKINPLADIGIDFDSINRKEKLKEKSSAAAVTSTITMGKAMGYGSGMGRAGASALAPPPNSVLGSGMGMGMGGGANMGMMGMGMGSYGGGMNQPMGMGMNMGMGMGQGAQFRPGTGLPPSGPGVPPGYNPNPMMGMGGYAAQQPYGGGYR